MGTVSIGRKRFIHHAAAAVFICVVAGAASAQQTPGGGQTEKPPETAPPQAAPSSSPVPTFATLGPSREIKLAEYTWFRFGAQVQAWYRAAQDRIIQPDGSDGSYAMDFYCRRCRFFTTGSVFKDIYFNVLFEASNAGRADPTTGAKAPSTPSILDAYGQVKFADFFWLSGGSILMPLTRNGLQPTTTYVSIDNANVDTTPILQGNSNVLRDLGFQANGFFVANHVEYRLGVFQGSRQASIPTQTASHNAPRFVAMVSANLWDTETGYVNGGHYFGARRILGVMGNFDYQIFRKNAPPAPGADKNAYYGISGAVFLNYPLSGTPSRQGGDEIVGLLQFGYYDGGLRLSPTGTITNAGTYPAVLKQTNYLAEAGYYNHSLKVSVFGKFEKRKISDDYPLAFRQALPAAVPPIAPSQTWIAFGLKYYVAPFNFMNFALQYERINWDDAPSTQQGGTNNLVFQMQTLLY
jgi:hypothetical protein